MRRNTNERAKQKKEVQKHLVNIARITGDTRSVMENGLFRVDILIDKMNRLEQIAQDKRNDINTEIEWSDTVIKAYYTNFVDCFSTDEDWKHFLMED